MKKSFLLPITCLILLSCNTKKPDELIIGVWHSVPEDDGNYFVWTFYKDGTATTLGAKETSNGEDITYKLIHDGKILHMSDKNYYDPLQQKRMDNEFEEAIVKLNEDSLILNPCEGCDPQVLTSFYREK